MKKKTWPASKVINSADDVETIQHIADVTIEILSADEGLLSIYESIALRWYYFCSLQSLGLPRKIFFQTWTFVNFKKFDEGRNDLVSFYEAALKAFFQAHNLFSGKTLLVYSFMEIKIQKNNLILFFLKLLLSP